MWPRSRGWGAEEETRATLIWVRAGRVYHSPAQTKNDHLMTTRLPIARPRFAFGWLMKAPTSGSGVCGGDKVGAIGSLAEQSHLDTIFMPRSRRVRDRGSLFPKQNNLPPNQTNATNFVLALIGLSLPHPIKAVAPSIFLVGPFSLPNQSTAVSSACRL